MAPKNTSSPPPALLLGTGLTVLGVLRALGRSGVPSICLSEGPEFETYSRWYVRAPFQIGSFGTAAELAERLSELTCPRAVIIPCSDHWTIEATKLPPELSDRFRTSLPKTAVIESLIDKARFRAAVAKAGVPHPLTEPVRDEVHLAKLMESAPDGVFLKPVDSQRFVTEFHCKAFNVSTVEDALRCFRKAHEKGIELVLQQYIPGGSDQHYLIEGYVDREHRVAAVMARRRLRMHPPDFGNSCYTVSVDLSVVQDALEALKKLFVQTGYRGAFNVEYKRDARDGGLKIIEINCRPWWFVEFASRCGVNVPEMIYREALGESLPTVGAYPVGEELVYSYHDLRACLLLARNGQAQFADWIRSWLRSRKAIFSWDDPAPAVWNLGKRIRNWILNRLGKRRTAHS